MHRPRGLEQSLEQGKRGVRPPSNLALRISWESTTLAFLVSYVFGLFLGICRLAEALRLNPPTRASTSKDRGKRRYLPVEHPRREKPML